MTEIGPGTRVKCIDGDSWHGAHSGDHHTGPKTGTVWTVDYVFPAEGYLVLKEWKKEYSWIRRFNPAKFIPIDGEAEIEKLRALLNEPNNIKIPSKVGADA